MEKIAARVVAVALVLAVAVAVLVAVAVAVAVGVQAIVLVVALASVIVAVQTTVAILGVIAKTTTVAMILATMVVILVATLAMRIVTMFPTPMGYRHRVLILTVCILSPWHLVNPRLVKRCQGVTRHQEWSHFPVISRHFSMSQHRFTWTQMSGIQMHLRASSRHFSSAV